MRVVCNFSLVSNIAVPLLVMSAAFGGSVSNDLISGDLVFVQPPYNLQSPFDAAILATGKATVEWMRRNGYALPKGAENKTATHVAVAMRESDGSLHFVQAVPMMGVVKTSAQDFFRDNGAKRGSTFYFGRLTNCDRTAAEDASRIAETEVGKKYANDFSPPPSEFYCSSLVDYAYARALNRQSLDVFIAKRFTLIFEPLSFWKKYYDQMGMKLPVNVTGTNPTLLLHSPAVALFQSTAAPSFL